MTTRHVIAAGQFRKVVKLAKKRHYDMGKLRDAIELLVRATALPTGYRDHALSGNWKHFPECHIEPDWLLIYKIEGEDLQLVRTGTHADLF